MLTISNNSMLICAVVLLSSGSLVVGNPDQSNDPVNTRSPQDVILTHAIEDKELVRTFTRDPTQILREVQHLRRTVARLALQLQECTESLVAERAGRVSGWRRLLPLR